MVLYLVPSALFPPRVGTLPLAIRGPCATRLHNRIPAHSSVSPISRAPAPSSSQPALTRASRRAVTARGSTSGNRPCAAILGSGAPGIDQTTSASPLANTVPPELHIDISRALQTEYPSRLPCAAPTRGSHQFVRVRTA